MIGAWITINQSFHIEGEKRLHGKLGSTTEQTYN
jgi:hypothetical protein